MKNAWERSKIPIIGVIGIFLITMIAFLVVKPGALTVEKTRWSLTGNAILKQAVVDGKISMANDCSNIDEPVCGQDGQTYKNLCYARKAGTDMQYRGTCKE